jgi:hypothetical protein
LTDGAEDQDHDGVVDTAETDPCDPDTDHDGLNDGDEVNTFNTSPLDWDSDGDYLPDLYEAMNLASSPTFDPTNALDGPLDFEASGFEDGNPNYQEYWNGSDPWGKDPVPNPLFPDSPGCYYWAEADGDGWAMPGDRAIMQLKVLGLTVSYANVIPDNGDGQDLDGDGFIMVGDLTIMRAFMLNAPVGTVGSRAAALEKVYEPLGPVAVGGTAHVTVAVRNEGGAANNCSASFSVVFSIDPSSTGSAVLPGGDGSYGANTRFDVSGPSGAADGGHATIHMKATAPGTIVINAAIPACGASGIGRWMDQVALDPGLMITAQ